MMRTWCVTLPVLALGAGATVAAPETFASAPAASAPTASYSVRERGPLSLLVAGDARSPHALLDTRWPIGRRPFGGTRSPMLQLEAMSVTLARPGDASIAARDLAWTARIAQRTDRAGRWFGASTGGAGELDGARTRYRLSMGGWRWFSPFELEGSVLTETRRYERDDRFSQLRTVRVRNLPPADTLNPFRDSLVTVFDDRSILWTTGQAAVRWRRGRIELETTAGLSVGRRLSPQRWAQSTLRAQLSRHVLLVASAGQRPSGSLVFDANAQPRTMVGLQLAPWSAAGWAMSPALRPTSLAWQARALADGRQLIRVRCRDATRVELAADFTDWNPIEMQAVHSGWWAIALPIEPGVHRVRLRLDGGEWISPAGLPRAEHVSGDVAGLFVVE